MEGGIQMSFASDIRAKLCAEMPQKLCCRRTYIYGFLYTSATGNDGEIEVALSGEPVTGHFATLIETAYHVKPHITKRSGRGGAVNVHLHSNSAQKYLDSIADGDTQLPSNKCAECGMYFLRGAFLSCGFPSDPQNEFRLDFAPRHRAQGLFSYLSSIGLLGHLGKRSGKDIVYFRSGEKIGDFFGHLGLMDTYFEIQNEYLRRELNNLTNRQNNVTVRNIERSVESTAEQVQLILQLKEQHLFSLLPEELIATAELRLAYADYSLSQLAAVAVPAISKSGLNHRLKKITEFAKQHLR